MNDFDSRTLENWRRFEKKEQIYEKNAEYIELMRVPAVEKAINRALTQILELKELEKEQAK